MTQKIIELKQAPVVLVELPEGAYYENLCFLPPAPGINYFLYENGVNTPYKEIVPGIDKNWTKLGYLSDLTEEQFAKCVDDNGNGDYRNYIGMRGGFETDEQSFCSLLEYEKVYTENPHDYMLQSTEENFDNCKCCKTELQIVREKWEQAQQRTIDPKRTVVLLRKEETK